jgi:2'-5' RNA ligase
MRVSGMNYSMRLFVAIEISPEIRDKIADYISRLKPNLADARWVRADGLHVTLKFLGNVADERSKTVGDALRGVQSPSLTFSVRDIGFFPNPRSPRVLWTGIEAGPGLAKLAHEVDAALAPLGFDREKPEFNPHVTLARFKDLRGKTGISSIEEKPSFGTMTAKDFHLYESKLSPQGSRYIKLASFELK